MKWIDIPVPANFLPEYPWKDSINNGPGLRDEALAAYPRTEYAVQIHIQEYYAIISHLDHQVGEILEALEASGKMENTYVFFTADHGLAVGQHGLIGKQNLFDHIVRVPLMVDGSGVPRGQKLNRMFTGRISWHPHWSWPGSINLTMLSSIALWI